jgi:FMN phosphatase YigB (HAD superfamily)
MSIKVIAFDVHQTLVYWPQGRVQAIEVQRLLSRFGIHISYWTYDAVRQSILLLDASKREIHGWVDYLALVFARMQVPVSLDLLASLATMHESRDGMELYPDALDALKTAKVAGLLTCTFTTLPLFMLGRAADEIKPCLDDYFNCSSVGAAKGDNRFYERITEKLAVPPESILCVGDDPLSDVQLPTEAGWRAVLLDRAGKHRGLRAGQLGTISSLGELEQYYS